MLPTLKPGQFLISWNWFYKPIQGDLVVVKKNRLMVKRIQDIKKQKVFVVGDNLTDSTDSRQFGWVEKRQIVGKVIFKYN